MSACIEGYDAGFVHRGSFVVLGGISEPDGEAERTLVEDFKGLVALRHKEASVRLQKCIGSTSEGGSYGVAIHSLSVVDMVAESVIHLICQVVIASVVELLAHRAHFLILFRGIPVVEHEVGCALVEKVITHGSSVSVHSISHTVVLPAKFVLALREEASLCSDFVLPGSAFLHIIDRLSLCSHSCLEDEFAVPGQLRGDFPAVGIGHDYMFRVGQFLLDDREVCLHHFHTGSGERVGNYECQLVGCVHEGCRHQC